jgi:GNAT superfamily N-acetyltransferase
MSGNYKIEMIRKDLRGIPEYSLPGGYSFRWHSPGNSARWSEIQSKADLYNDISDTLFEEQFGSEFELQNERILFLMRGDEYIGTASAWFDNDYHGERWGRIHWVAIVPEYQGRGLAKPLMGAVCRRLLELGHEKAYLSTSTVRIPAVNLYLSLDFSPAIYSKKDRSAWKMIENTLKFSLNLP